MAIAERTKRKWGISIRRKYANEIAAIIDAGTGTISQRARRMLRVSMGRVAAQDFATIVDASDGAIADTTLRRLHLACGSHVAGNDINTGIIANVDE